MTFPAVEPIHYFRNETGAIACPDAPYAAELTDDPARVTCAPCIEYIAAPPRRNFAPTNSLDAALDELDWGDPSAIPLETSSSERRRPAAWVPARPRLTARAAPTAQPAAGQNRGTLSTQPPAEFALPKGVPRCLTKGPKTPSIP